MVAILRYIKGYYSLKSTTQLKNPKYTCNIDLNNLVIFLSNLTPFIIIASPTTAL